MDKQRLMELIRASLWGTPVPDHVDEDIFDEMRAHGIYALAAPVLGQLDMPDDLRQEWDRAIAQQMGRYIRYMYAQKTLPVTVPYVILKGTEAARYYPHPEYRAMGDIDIMTAREDYPTACGQLLQAGYTLESVEEYVRHKEFKKDGTIVEAHLFFASMNDPEAARYLDDRILESIGPSHVLPDRINGLVLLEHISHHLERGLGLRQIIDWMMFAHRCLTEAEWPAFRDMARNIGLEKLAVTTTRMCEIYMGLEPHKWCAGADEGLCGQLMDYVLASGNFGHKQLPGDEKVSKEVLFNLRYPVLTYTTLQRRGLVNWKAAQKHRFLRPFAWLYQVGHYAHKALSRQGGVASLKTEAAAARQKGLLLDALGTRQQAKGIAVYRDGTYQIEKEL